MTDEYDNRNSGALFKNDKRQHDRQPHYRGEVCVVCEHCGAESQFWLSSWIKDMRKGGKFMSLALTGKDAAPAQDANVDTDEDIPF